MSEIYLMLYCPSCPVSSWNSCMQATVWVFVDQLMDHEPLAERVKWGSHTKKQLHEDSEAGISNLIGTGNQFLRSQFFQGLSVVVVILGWFIHIAFIMHYVYHYVRVSWEICNLDPAPARFTVKFKLVWKSNARQSDRKQSWSDRWCYKHK